MGFNLKNTLGEDYQVVGFSFSTGSFMGVGSNSSFGLQTIYSLPSTDSVNYIFHHVLYENFILPLQWLQPGLEISEWLSIKRKHICIGAMWLPNNMYEWVVLPELYDLIIYFDETTAAHQF
jgi:erythromycin esterase-like protein